MLTPEEIQEFADNYNREQVVLLQATELVEQWDKLREAQHAASLAEAAVRAARKTYADMLAQALNVSVGMRVSVTKAHGFGKDSPKRTSTYEVTGYSLYNGTSLSLKGRTVLKDGSLGEVRDIPGDWTRVEEVK